MRAVCQLELNNKKRMLKASLFYCSEQVPHHEQKQASVAILSHLRCL